MKKQIFLLATVALVTLSILTGCSTSSDKVVDGQNNVVTANEDMNDTNKAYLADMENYKAQSAAKITANEKSLSDFKSRVDLQKKEAQDDYKAKIAMLEMKNSDMKKKMDDYKTEGIDKWETFKTEFSHDMDELEKAFKDLAVNNVR